MPWLVRGLLLALVGFTSCTSLYFPPPAHAPLLTQQGEFNGAISTNQYTNFALQGAYAVTNHLAAAGTFSSVHRNRGHNTYDMDFGEASLGYFTRLSDKRVLEVYVGGGGGSTHRLERDANRLPTSEQNGTLGKAFVQVNYARKKQRNLHLFRHDFPLTYGVALRMSYLQLSSFRIDGQLNPSISNVFFEPITFTRVQLAGPFQLQLMSGNNLGFHPNKYLKAANAVFQVGLLVDIGGANATRP